MVHDSEHPVEGPHNGASHERETFGQGFSSEESGAIVSEAQRGSALDRAIARRLEHRPSTADAVSRSYIQDLGQRARLPAAVERQLVAKAIDGDRDARGQLVEAFLPLVGSVARNYRNSPQITRNELMQEGVVGLLRALERFDPGLGVPFWGYAQWWVRQAMQQLVAELTRPVVMSDRALRQMSQLKDAYTSLQRDGGTTPTLSELSDRTGLEATQLANLIAADRPPKALEEPIHGEEGEIGTFGDLIADPLAEDEYEHLVTSIASSQLRELLSGLSDRERTVLRARFGLEGPAESLREIASHMGLSAERVRQLENRALGKLRAAASNSEPGTHR
jgi:RNA polymerase sigma factor (sigma-70 family)